MPSILCTLPQDMLFVIANYMDAFNLIRLASTCKMFQSLCYSKVKQPWHHFVPYTFRFYYTTDSYLRFLERLAHHGKNYIVVHRQNKTQISKNFRNRSFNRYSKTIDIDGKSVTQKYLDYWEDNKKKVAEIEYLTPNYAFMF